jgi:MOSC domain-containing protein YiiM
MINQDGAPPFRCGVMAVVRTGGPVSVGDPVLVTLPDEPHEMLSLLCRVLPEHANAAFCVYD